MMASLLDDLRSFLMSNGYTNVFTLQYPAKPDDIISLHEREAPMAFGMRGINYGARAAPIQIRVRRSAPEAAEQVVQQLFHLLDSGPDEDSIALTSDRNATSRPTPPFFLEVDGDGRWVWVLKTTMITSGL